MWSCAALIGQTTHEIRYKRQDQPDTWLSQLMWLQPGPQVIGDQSFDSFAFFEKEGKRLKIWTSSTKDLSKKYEVHTWIAVLMVLVGYVMQFIGLRGMVAWISITQLGVTIIMSLLRGILRAERLNKHDNELNGIPDLVAKRELDWLAFELVKRSSGKSTPDQNPSWHFYGRCSTAKEQQDSAQTPSEHASGSTQSGNDLSTITTNWTHTEPHKRGFGCEDLLSIRTRLAYLTGHTFHISGINNGRYQAWKDDYVHVRNNARKLSTAICSAASILHKGQISKRYELSVQALSGAHQYRSMDTLLPLMPPPQDSFQATWHTDSAMLEAILGLWMWSLIYDPESLAIDNYGNTISMAEGIKQARIIAAKTRQKPYGQPLMDLWFGPDTVHLSDGMITLPQRESHGGLADLRHTNDEEIPLGPRSKVRFFGWDAIHQELVSEAMNVGSDTPTTHQTSPVPPTSMHIQFVYTEQSLIEICMQELFTAIIMSLLSLVGTGETTFSESDGRVRMKNPVVASLAAVFTEASLGTRSDALMCLVPALGEKCLPTHDDLLSGLVKEAKAYRKSLEWERAETLLRWACEYFIEAHIQDKTSTSATDIGSPIKQIFRETMEFYRLFLASYFAGDQKEKEKKVFAANGFSWVEEKYKQVRDVYISELHGCYQYVLNSNNPRPKDEWLLKKEFIQAIRERRRKDALYWLCFLDASDFHRGDETNRAGTGRYGRLDEALPLCVRNEWDELTQACLEMDANPSGKDQEGRTALSYSAELGLDRWVTRFIKIGKSLDERDRNFMTPFDWAVKGKHLKSIFDLMKSGKIYYAHSLWSPKYEHDKAYVQFLLENNIDNMSWRTFFGEKVDQGDEITVKLLLDHDASACFREYSQTPVYRSLVNENYSMLRLLLEKGANTSLTSFEELPLRVREAADVPGFEFSFSPWRTPLARAAGCGDIGLVQLLLKAGAATEEYSLGNTVGDPPIYWALRMGHPAIVRILLEYGASVTREKTGSSLRPLTFAAIMGEVESVKVLLEYDKDIESAHRGLTVDYDNYGGPHRDGVGLEVYTPLTWAAKYGQHSTIRTLLEEGAADIEGRSGDATPLWAAAEEGHIASVLLLLQKGANIENKDKKGRTALEAAAMKGQEEAVRVLFEKGGNIHHRNNAGDTLLWTAAWYGQQGVVKLLLGMEEYGAYAELQDDKWFTTLEKRKNDNWRDLQNERWDLEQKGYGEHGSYFKEVREKFEAIMPSVKDCAKIIEAAYFVTSLLDNVP